MDPVTIGACISGATKAYNMVAKAVNAGREIEDTAQWLGKFFDSKEKISEIEQENKYGPKFLRGNSIEAQALEIQMAKHKTEQMEKQLRELCMYTVGMDFYNEMMATRRRLRQIRLQEAKAKAERRRLLIDGGLIVGALMISAGVIWFAVAIIVGAKA